MRVKRLLTEEGDIGQIAALVYPDLLLGHVFLKVQLVEQVVADAYHLQKLHLGR